MEIDCEILRDLLILNSPWCITRACMVVKGWEEGMQLKKMAFSILSFRVQIYNPPFESINSRNGFDLGRRIRNPIESNGDVCHNELGPFLMVKFGLNTRNPLPMCISYKMKNGEIDTLPIKIENLGPYCFQCWKIGYERSNAT